MKLAPTLALLGAAAPLALALAALAPNEASACGGCFVPPDVVTQVTGHRMIVSISKNETTLWDQISYDGSPEDFAWVLPTKGIVEVGLSSDALFQVMDDGTRPSVSAPPLNCPPTNCGSPTASFGEDSGAGGAANEGGVDVLAQEVVGPYATVQLAADDPNALRDWLDENGYGVPDDIDPIIDAYVGEGFNFLAMKLVPGAGISAMRPVRVSTAGAGIALPLRMVAAGTGAQTPISLFVVSEGRYEASNFANAEIDPSALVWNWTESRSNYVELAEAALAEHDGAAFLTQAAFPIYPSYFYDSLSYLIDYEPSSSGYGDATGAGAAAEFEADMLKLTGSLYPSAVWLGRMYADLPRAALADDLLLTASPGQEQLYPFFQAQTAIGDPPACPSACNDGWDYASGTVTLGGGGGCNLGDRSASFAGGLALVALGLGLRRRRRGA